MIYRMVPFPVTLSDL